MSLRKEIMDKLIERAAPLFGKKPEELTAATRLRTSTPRAPRSPRSPPSSRTSLTPRSPS